MIRVVNDTLLYLMFAGFLVVFDRFMQLVQREWINGGHPFSLRHNHVTSAPEKDKGPIFLLFLDAVWQVHNTLHSTSLHTL